MIDLKEVPKLEKIEFQLTSECNMYCVFCFNNDRCKTDVLAPGLICRVIRELNSSSDPCAGLKIVWLTGGEPLLEKESVLRIGRECKSLGLYCGVSTNGLLLSEYSQELSGGGVNEVRVSLDSTKPEVFEKIRGAPGSFSRVIEGIRSCVENGLKTSIRFTVTKDNIGEAEEVVRMASDLGVSLVEVKGVLPIGRGEKKMMAEPKKLEEEFRRAVRAGGKKTKIVIMCNYLPLCEGFTVKQNIACICARSAAYVACNGAIVPCSYFPHKSDFNIHEHSILDAWKSPLFEQVRNVRPGKCVSCEHWDGCRNGCPALLYHYADLESPCFSVAQGI